MAAVAPSLLTHARALTPVPVATALSASIENVSGVFMLHGNTACGTEGGTQDGSSGLNQSDVDVSLFTPSAAIIIRNARSVAEAVPFDGDALRESIQELPTAMGIRARSGGKFSTWGSLQAAVAIPLLHPNVSVRHRAADGTVRGSDAGLDLKALIQQHGVQAWLLLVAQEAIRSGCVDSQTSGGCCNDRGGVG